MKKGNYYTIRIAKIIAVKGGIRIIESEINLKEKRYFIRDHVSQNFYNNHEVGDTIIIKFSPKLSKRSIIMENTEYKSCMGLPPEEGWKELPQCKDATSKK